MSQRAPKPRAKKTTVPKSLCQAINKGDLAAVERHLESVDVNATYSKGSWMTLLHLAVDSGHPEVVELLLDRGANPNPDNGADVPFYFACSSGNVRMVRALVKAGARFERGNTSSYYTDLGMAVEGGHAKVVELLLGLGVQPDAVGGCGITPLMHLFHVSGDGVAEADRLACARLLLAAGANPRKRDSGGDSVVKMAEALGEAQLVELLKGAGKRAK